MVRHFTSLCHFTTFGLLPPTWTCYCDCWCLSKSARWDMLIFFLSVFFWIMCFSIFCSLKWKQCSHVNDSLHVNIFFKNNVVTGNRSENQFPQVDFLQICSLIESPISSSNSSPTKSWAGLNSQFWGILHRISIAPKNLFFSVWQQLPKMTETTDYHIAIFIYSKSYKHTKTSLGLILFPLWPTQVLFWFCLTLVLLCEKIFCQIM